MYFLSTCIFYNKINKIMEVYSLPCVKKKKIYYFRFNFYFLFYLIFYIHFIFISKLYNVLFLKDVLHKNIIIYSLPSLIKK